MPPFSDVNELENLILEIIDAQSATQKQIRRMDQFYKQAKEIHSQGNISLAMEIMRSISGIPANIQELAEYHFKATGYAEALLFSPRSSVNIASVKVEPEPARKVNTPEFVSGQKAELNEENEDDDLSINFSAPRRPPSFQDDV